ncbi:MAG: hypothetical protein ACOY45_08675 [Pseudomonadota bacterium]
MIRRVHSILLLGTACAAVAAVPAAAQEQRQRPEIHPYIEASQVLSADLDGGDVLTYTSVAAGVDASIQSRRVQVQVNYRYEHRFSYDKDVGDDSIHSGLARAAVIVAPGFSVEGGAIATRTRSDVRGSAPIPNGTSNANIAQIYSVYAGPTLSTNLGALNVNAGYRFGYTKAETPGSDALLSGQPRLDLYDDSTVHSATASIGVKSGTVLPVGLTASGAWEREDAGQLDQRYEGKHVRGDVVLPVGRTLALEAGVGYEKIEISQRGALRDANGAPIADGAGRQQVDPASPRRLAYDVDGVFWDAGVIYRPDRRFMLEARVGRRYNSWSYTGSLQWQTGPGSGLQVGVYDSIDSFGRQLNSGIAALPTSFVAADDPFGNQYNGCVFGTVGSTSDGCLSSVFQSVSTANYRARGVDAVYTYSRGRTTLGLGAGYANRRYIAPREGNFFTLDGLTDQSWYGQVFATRQVGRNTSVGGNLFASYYDSDLPGSEGVLSWGGNGSLTHNWGRLGATATVGVYGFDAQQSDKDVAAQALLGLRYGF